MAIPSLSHLSAYNISKVFTQTVIAELVVHLHADVQLRVERAHERELKLFGERILEGGDMCEKHHKFLNDIAGYDYGIGGCTLQQHEIWLQSLQCSVIRLDGKHALEKNLKIIVDTYRSM